MDATETYGVMGFVDENGKQKIHYPVTQAELVGYDSTSSGLEADDAQGAIDELASGKADGAANSTDGGLAAFSGAGGKTLKKAGSKGSSKKGIYLDGNGVPQEMSYEVNKTVPSDAKFTDTTYINATQSAAGLMSANDKQKLDGVAAGAQVNSITGVKGNEEPTYRTGNVNLTPANIGAAASAHTHAATDINSGTLSSDRLPTVPISKGGTGQTTAAAARNALGLGNTTGAVPVANGGTGATTAAAARTNLEVYSKGEVDNLWWLSKTRVSLGLSPLITTVEAAGNNVGTITASSSATGVATTAVNGKTVTITAIAKGTTTVTITNSTTNTSKTVAVTVVDDIPSRTLSANTPDGIQAAARAGIASALWSVGDKTAPITFNDVTVGSLSMNGLSACAFIIGFNHNSGIEGSGVHLQFGKTTAGVDIAFCDSSYDNSDYGVAFRMNISNTTSGGWNNSYMRKTICPAFLTALPTAWQNVIAACTKYSDNTGGGSDTASYVTSTSDKIWLLAEWEVFGARTGANSAEKNYQAQYDYYANGNSKIKRKHNATTTFCGWWLRSVHASRTMTFHFATATGSSNDTDAYGSLGFAPGFKVA